MAAVARPHRRDGAPTLEIRDLTVDVVQGRREGRILRDVSLEVWPGEIVGLIGESGSGKSMTALSVLGLLPARTKIAGGDIRLDGRSLLQMQAAELRAMRGDRMAMIPQDAMAAMNPVLRVGTQVGEPYVLHRNMRWRAARSRAAGLLRRVHVPSSEERVRDYPHQFSGGMLQRSMIGMGLALDPSLMIADEPTTALDVTIQAQVLRLLREVRDEHDTSILFISHDLGVIGVLCDWVYVMYAGRIVEQGAVDDILSNPAHPYTRALLTAIPSVESDRGELASIEGRIPSPFEWSPACRFADRCEFRFDRCETEPALLPTGSDHEVRCWLVEDTG
jgi:oligopeptide/dipeptide ABC transporter ATP-binding protein